MYGRPITILGCPTELGLRRENDGIPSGVVLAPEALRRENLPRDLAARDLGDLVPLDHYSLEIDPAIGVLNPRGIRNYALRQADVVGDLLDRREVPLLLGGDCSLLLGSLLALRRRGPCGVVFIDGHTDFYSPETSGTKAAAGMDLALACGSGPAALTTFDGRGPLVESRYVVHLARRDELESNPGGLLPAEVLDLPLATVRSGGTDDAAARALARVEQVEAFWIHVDVDVLHDDFMPAVDSRQPGGLLPDELVDLVAPLLRSPRAAGIELTIFDPRRDPDGELSRRLSELVVRLFRGR